MRRIKPDHVLLILNDTSWTPIAFGMIVTFGLLILAPMEAFEFKQRVDKTRTTIARQPDQMTNRMRAVSKEEAEFQRRLKYTPTKYRENLLAKRNGAPQLTAAYSGASHRRWSAARVRPTGPGKQRVTLRGWATKPAPFFLFG